MSKSNLICSPQIWLSSLVNGITRHLNSECIFGPSLSLPRDTYLELDILECEVKWALGSITTNKASGGDEIPAELFQILKDNAVKVLHSMCQQIWKTQKCPQDWKRFSFHSNPTAKGNDKERSNYRTIALISHAERNAQNSPSQASAILESWPSRCSSWF